MGQADFKIRVIELVPKHKGIFLVSITIHCQWLLITDTF